jgi:diguanylate cyclase (GGDEF)-like protein
MADSFDYATLTTRNFDYVAAEVHQKVRGSTNLIGGCGMGSSVAICAAPSGRWSESMATPMKAEDMNDSPADMTRAKSLTTVLGQSEQVKELVEECAEELVAVNATLKQEAQAPDQSPTVANALLQSEAVEGKVQDAADQLTVVNQALAAEVDARHLLEQQLASATRGEEAARHAAFHDPLTGLPNRALFDDRLELGLAQVTRHERGLAVMFIDLDGFKKINDEYGHDAGDAVLRAVSARLKENTRDDDTVSRHGGDEFLCLLMEMGDEKDISVIAEKLVAAIQKPCRFSAGELAVRASIGIAIYPQHGAVALELVRNADAAMYRAKRGNLGYAFAG